MLARAKTDLSQENSTRADPFISPGMSSALALQYEPPERMNRGFESRIVSVALTMLLNGIYEQNLSHSEKVVAHPNAKSP